MRFLFPEVFLVGRLRSRPPEERRGLEFVTRAAHSERVSRTHSKGESQEVLGNSIFTTHAKSVSRANSIRNGKFFFYITLRQQVKRSQ